MSTKLPKDLRYLSRALDDLEDQEGPLNEADTSALREALLTRIGGMPEEKAQKRLDDDLEVLDHWLEDSDDASEEAMFVLRFMMKPGLARELLDEHDED